jgi:uncharacterized Zn-binding protein involved in type VI secretion
MTKVVRLGDPSNHGGVVISSCSRTRAEGILISRLGDLHSCPIPGHGVTPIVSGVCGRTYTEGKLTAHDGCVAACGAVISATVSRTHFE